MQARSLQPYENFKPKRKTDQEKILTVLKKDKALTYHEIALDLRLKFYNEKNHREALKWTNPNKISRRIPELIRLGKVKLKEVRKCSIVDSNCNTYVLV